MSAPADGAAQVTLIGTGSEISIAMEAQKLQAEDGEARMRGFTTGAVIGDGVVIAPGCVVGRDAQIGDQSRMHRVVFAPGRVHSSSVDARGPAVQPLCEM